MVKKFSHVVPLLTGAFILTSVVALTGPNSQVLGDETENLANDGTEIKEVKVIDSPKVEKSKLENIVKNEGRKKEIEIKGENGKVKVKIENKVRELKIEEAKLRLRVKEASPPGENNKKENRNRNEDGDKVEMEDEKEVGLSVNDNDEIEIEDQEHKVESKFPITVDQETNTFSLVTPNGDVKVKTLPSTAIDNMVENKVFNQVSEVKIEESTTEDGKAVIKVDGRNRYKFLGIIPFSAEIKAEVDPTTGDVTKLAKPWYLNSLKFLFSQ